MSVDASVNDATELRKRCIAVLEQPEVTGGRVGRLQVGCCAPGRLPLHADLLKGLTKAQLARNAAVGQGHGRR
jgi:hypothetical protein